MCTTCFKSYVLKQSNQRAAANVKLLCGQGLLLRGLEVHDVIIKKNQHAVIIYMNLLLLMLSTLSKLPPDAQTVLYHVKHCSCRAARCTLKDPIAQDVVCMAQSCTRAYCWGQKTRQSNLDLLHATTHQGTRDDPVDLPTFSEFFDAHSTRLETLR